MNYVQINTCTAMALSKYTDDKVISLTFIPNSENVVNEDMYFVDTIENFISKAKELFPICNELNFSISFTDDRPIPKYNHEEAVKNRTPIVFNKSAHKDEIQNEVKNVISQIYENYTDDIILDSPIVYNLYARNVDFSTMLHINDTDNPKVITSEDGSIETSDYSVVE